MEFVLLLEKVLYIFWIISSLYLAYDVKRVTKKFGTALIYFFGSLMLWIIIFPVWFFYDRKKNNGENYPLSITSKSFVFLSFLFAILFTLIYFFGNFLIFGLNGMGESCEVDSDCLSNNCIAAANNKICSQGQTGSLCRKDNDCMSFNCKNSICESPFSKGSIYG